MRKNKKNINEGGLTKTLLDYRPPNSNTMEATPISTSLSGITSTDEAIESGIGQLSFLGCPGRPYPRGRPRDGAPALFKSCLPDFDNRNNPIVASKRSW